MLLALLAAIPGIGSIVTALTSSFFSAKVAITQAKIGGDVAVATALVKASAVADHESTAKLSIIAGSKVLLALVIAFAAPLVIYEWKIIIVDIVIGPGSFLGWTWVGNTDPIKGEVAAWGTTIIAALFGSSTTLAVGSMFFNRPQSP